MTKLKYRLCSAMSKISLSKPQYTYLCQAAFIQKRHRESLFSAQQISDDHLISVSEDQANEIRDLCGEQSTRS
jgi:hypothetical protein